MKRDVYNFWGSVGSGQSYIFGWYKLVGVRLSRVGLLLLLLIFLDLTQILFAIFICLFFPSLFLSSFVSIFTQFYFEDSFTEKIQIAITRQKQRQEFCSLWKMEIFIIFMFLFVAFYVLSFLFLSYFDFSFLTCTVQRMAF